MKCQGECSKENLCEGEVKEVFVSGNGFHKPFNFTYCEVAIKEDERRGFLVEEKEEEHPYADGIPIPPNA